MSYKVAVVGASGNVGREILQIMSEREFPASDILALASKRSVGREVSYGEKQTIRIQDLANCNFSGIDIVLSSPGAAVSAEFSPKAAKSGAVVIDNTSQWRMDPDVPLVVPEVNGDEIIGYKKKGIIANPNCSTIQLVTAMKPLHDIARIKRCVVSTYQSVSGAGKKAMDELFNQTKAVYANQPLEKFRGEFSKQIAFNCIPHIDKFLDDGTTKEEWKMAGETKKILDSKIGVTATCVRVPVFIGHAEAVNLSFEKSISAADARKALQSAPGLSVVDHRVDEGYVTPQECGGEDAVFVSRIREDPTIENGLNLWIVADNLRKGAALNTVQIAEALIAKF
ncbi:MAG: aspartate-semialdehyde dehydrogenase [Magnetovibrio sp.]|nr:aspartate-semialdehyde dehydrogenase [Magnetovibrio sp.]